MEVADYEAVAGLLSVTRRRPFAAAQLARLANLGHPVWRPRVATLEGGEIAGVCLLYQSGSDGDGRYNIHVDVLPERQRQGIGTALYEDAVDFAWGNGLASLYGYVYEDRPGGLAFARQKGFTAVRQAIHSQLNVAAFDESGFARLLAENEAQGIRFTSFAGEGDSEENRRRLYALNKRCSADIPGRGPFFSFEEFCRVRFGGHAYRPEGIVLALDGDAWVGLSVATYHDEGPFVFNQMTGVLPDYRRRGLAVALKVLVVRFAREAGATTVRTFNDAENVAMLGVNKRLGYERLPSSYTMEWKA